MTKIASTNRVGLDNRRGLWISRFFRSSAINRLINDFANSRVKSMGTTLDMINNG